jgi:hypothetical protein
VTFLVVKLTLKIALKLLLLTGGEALIFKNYVVRVYRCEKDNPRNLVGIVEETGVEERKAFTNLDELWKILSLKNFMGEDEKTTHLR